MRLVCANPDWLAKYQQLCVDRELRYTPWPSRLALLAAEGDSLVAGVMAYDTSGPFLFFEHLVTDPSAPLSLRWAAVDLMASEVLTVCRVLSKLPQVVVSSRGIAKILRRHGLQSTHAVVYSCPFISLEKHDENPLPAAQHPDRVSNPPRTGQAHHRSPEDNPPLCPPVG